VLSREGHPTLKPVTAGYESFRGTGFLIGKNVLVTCWHCVSPDIDDEDTFAVAVRWSDADKRSRKVPPNSTYFVRNLYDIQQDLNGTDLATAKVDLNPEKLTLGEDNLGYGSSLWTFGFPNTRDLPHPERGRSITLQGRYLQGYLTRTFWNETPHFGQVPSYELHMPAPIGLSGAPICELGTENVVGVIYGAHSTGNMAELEQLTTFAAAHMNRTLRDLRGFATEGLPLAEYLSS
jgi:Trypsin-like peptidase domain